MLDQSFSKENLSKIIDYLNRKGINFADHYFPKVRTKTEAIKKISKQIKEARESKSSHTHFSNLYKQRIKAKELRAQTLDKELEIICKKILARDFKISIRKATVSGRKDLFIAEDKPENHLVIKKLQENISRLYKVKQGNRHSIVSQIKLLCEDSFPKYILKTDIENCFESIPHEKLTRKINKDGLLTFFSKKIILQILDRYKTLSGNIDGLPRGIGVSAYLCELYLRDIDKYVEKMPDVIFYARFVDDIIIMFSPSEGQKDDMYIEKKFEELSKHIFDKFNLKLNASAGKTVKLNLTTSIAKLDMEYLGYRIFNEKGKAKFDLTNKKIERYKKKIDLTFSAYLKESKLNKRAASKNLKKRIRFLTGNARLKNNKENILVGIYYSNPLITHTDSIKKLDEYLQTMSRKTVLPTRLNQKILTYSFLEGFDPKKLSPFSTNELKTIVSIWKNRL